MSDSGLFFFFQAEDGIRDLVRSRGLGDVYKRQRWDILQALQRMIAENPEKIGGFAEDDLAPYLAMNLSLIHI